MLLVYRVMLSLFSDTFEYFWNPPLYWHLGLRHLWWMAGESQKPFMWTERPCLLEQLLVCALELSINISSAISLAWMFVCLLHKSCDEIGSRIAAKTSRSIFGMFLKNLNSTVNMLVWPQQKWDWLKNSVLSYQPILK